MTGGCGAGGRVYLGGPGCGDWLRRGEVFDGRSMVSVPGPLGSGGKLEKGAIGGHAR